MTSLNRVLAFDSGSSTISVALLTDGEIRSSVEPQTRSSTQVPRLANKLLRDQGCEWTDLDGVVAARGPGSFTGLRVGMAFALGLHQALQVPATAVSTLALLACGATTDGPVVAAVNAWRGCWFTQPYDARGPLETTGAGSQLRHALRSPQRVSLPETDNTEMPIVLATADDSLPRAQVLDRPVAAIAIDLTTHPEFSWDATTLQQPLYLASAPAKLPAGRKPIIDFTTTRRAC